MCDSKGEKYVECYSTSTLTHFLRKKCSRKKKYINTKRRKTRKK